MTRTAWAALATVAVAAAIYAHMALVASIHAEMWDEWTDVDHG